MKYELHDYLEKTIPRSTNQMSREIIHFSGSIELDRGLITFDNLFQWKYQVQRYKTMLFNVILLEIFLGSVFRRLAIFNTLIRLTMC